MMTSRTRLVLTIFGLVGLLVACGDAEVGAPAPEKGSGEVLAVGVSVPARGVVSRGQGSSPGVLATGTLAPPADHVVVDGGRESLGAVDLNPAPEALPRLLRRMSVDQLREAIRNTTGGLIWRDDRGRDMLTLLSDSLGVPDYIDATGEDLDASLVFQKFLGDGARSVCDEAISIDLQAAEGDRVLLRFVDPSLSWESTNDVGHAAIDENLRYMKLRFTGQFVGPDDEEGIASERWLLRSVTHATGDSSRGWRAVCVGLMSSPEFYLY